MFIFVFRIHCTFFIALPIRLKTCRSNVFFVFTRQNVRARKIRRVQRFCVPERARSTSGAQFVQACKPPSTNMARCSLIYDLSLISYLVFMFFKEIFSTKTFLCKIFSNSIKYIYDNESVELPTILICLPNIFSETLNRNYHNLSM